MSDYTESWPDFAERIAKRMVNHQECEDSAPTCTCWQDARRLREFAAEHRTMSISLGENHDPKDSAGAIPDFESDFRLPTRITLAYSRATAGAAIRATACLARMTRIAATTATCAMRARRKP